MPLTHPWYLQPPFRLPETWYRGAIARLQARLEENGLDGILLSNIWNIIYFSGLFHTATERPFWLFIPAQGEPTFFCPGLDRELVGSWWITDLEWYFDYPHHGPFNRLVFEPGPAEDIHAWLLRGLAARGYDRATLGFDGPVPADLAERLREVAPQAALKPSGDLCLKLRQIKTTEELALIRKVLAFQDHLLSYARGYILRHGIRTTDFEIRHAVERYGARLLMEAMTPDGRPHSAVGVNLWFTCRAGPATGYPHPNQFFYHRLQRGDAIQLAGFVHIGGYVGECYRALQTMPASDLQRRVWDVHTAMTELQAELCRVGARCNAIAGAVLRLARDAGLSEYIYHRPAHGIGMEGHQPPYISLGDETVLEEGMLLSNEPGLYNPAAGWGYNHSNTILVGKERGIVLNETPLTREWCWLEL
ncbi:MAG: aminopeptidase P family protein [Chloroflexi bacterium]|nr:aminopeptidase P family protein [Chloroflexota bacterium]